MSAEGSDADENRPGPHCGCHTCRLHYGTPDEQRRAQRRQEIDREWEAEEKIINADFERAVRPWADRMREQLRAARQRRQGKLDAMGGPR